MNQYLLSIMNGQRRGLMAGVLRLALWPLSLVYGLGVFCHRGLYRFHWMASYRSPKPVISVGNMTVGGAGKTPLVIWLARQLQAKGLKPAILIRGYKSKHGLSDEAGMLQKVLPQAPVLIGANRKASIEHAMANLSVDVFICDDGFQHWPLQRDLDIIAIDAANPFGNGHLLPSGILREPLTALKRACVIVLTKTDQARDAADVRRQIHAMNPRALIVESCHRPVHVADVFSGEVMPLAFLKGKTMVGFCAIGSPASFEKSLKDCGAQMKKMFPFMDHHVYQPRDMERVLEFCRINRIQMLVTTHKDAVKLRPLKVLFQEGQLVYLSVQLEITKGSDEFIQRVLSTCRC